jgi:hypothetical protein
MEALHEKKEMIYRCAECQALASIVNGTIQRTCQHETIEVIAECRAHVVGQGSIV